eukprot:489333-Pelagomonas_calceolata.AAC.1
MNSQAALPQNIVAVELATMGPSFHTHALRGGIGCRVAKPMRAIASPPRAEKTCMHCNHCNNCCHVTACVV